MARHWWMLPIPSFSDCSWAESDVDRGRPVATRNALERANLFLEGYFRALYVPLGGLKTWMENTPSLKFYISIFSDKPPCMPFCFSAAVVLPEVAVSFSFFISSFLISVAVTFSSFLAFVVAAFTSFLASAVGAFFSSFFFLLSLLLPIPLLS